MNKYGRMRREFLEEQNPMFFDDRVLTEQLFPHLYEVQEIAEKRVEVIMAGLLEKNPAPDRGNGCYGLDKTHECAERNGGRSGG